MLTQAVPLAVLGRLQPVPAAYLKQLATDNNVFPELPENVQRQVCRSSGSIKVFRVSIKVKIRVGMRADQSNRAEHQRHDNCMTSYASISWGRAASVRCYTDVVGLPRTGRTQNHSIPGGSKRAPLQPRSDQASGTTSQSSTLHGLQ